MVSILLSGSGDGKTSFWISPLSEAGIPASAALPVEITNQGIFDIANSLLSPTDPLFNVGGGNYIQFMQRYLPAIALNGDNSPGQIATYNVDCIAMDTANANFIKVKKAAQAEFQDESNSGITTITNFQVWLSEGNYPSWAAAQQAQQGAATTVQNDLARMNGTDAPLIAGLTAKLASAIGGNSVAGMNMSCSLVPALIIANNTWPDKLATVLEPLYTINSSYTSTVDGWISSFSKDPTAPPQVSIDFNVGNAAGETWSDLGHNDLDVNVSASRGCFFSATFKENNKITTSYVNASSNANDPQATITMQSFGTFPVTAGQWALNNLRSFPLLTNAPKDLKDPTYKVSQVCMAYGVGFTIKLSGETANQVDSYIQKVNKTGAGGSISIFGYEIGASVTSTSDSTQTWDDWYKTYKSGTITVKPSNNAVPTMIGALGVSV